MIHAAAMFAGLWITWLLLTQRWSAPEDLAIGAGAALVCTLLAGRLGGFEGQSPFANAPNFMRFAFRRAPTVLSGALATIRAAIAADVTLKPALVRIRTRPSNDIAQATLAILISAAPGAVVVQADSDGLLVHVLDEDSIDATAIGALETRVIDAVAGGRAP